MRQRRRRNITGSKSLKERLASFTKAMQDKASKLPPGMERDILVEKLEKADLASQMAEWLNSSDLQPPK
jgi:hypothetical protein